MTPTRGPWHVDYCDGLVVLGAPGTAGTPTYPNDKRIICEIPALAAEGLTAEDEANAELIAAAPAMRDALQNLREVVTDILLPKVSGEGWLVEQLRVDAVFREVDAALAQAEGRKVAAP